MECAVTKLHHDCLLTLDQLDNTTLPRLPVGCIGSILHDFCKDKLIIDSDKDSGSVVMSAQCYLDEQAAKLRETTSAGLRYYEMLSPCVDWVAEASLWFQIVRYTMLVCMPDSFEPVIMPFLNSVVKFSLPTFYLFAKTHKHMLVVNSRWPSRPVTALTAWVTKSPSILLTTLATVLLKIDRLDDAQQTPLRDTHDVVRRLTEVFGSPGRSDLLLTSIDFTVLYTNIRSGDTKKAIRFWLQRFAARSKLHVGGLSTEEMAFAAWMATPVYRGNFEA